MIAVKLSEKFQIADNIQFVISAIVAAVTVSGKAIGKGIAIKKANNIIDNFSKILYPFVNKK